MEGAKLPVYTATPLGAASGELADHAGNVLLITTWASWCTICKGDEPIWDSLHADFAAEGLTVFAVSREASESSARGYFESKEFRYPAFWDDGVNMALGMRDYQPNHMLVDRDGIIQSVYEGSLRARPGGEDGLRADVAALLG